MRGLNNLETQLGGQIPTQLQAARQQVPDDYRPLCLCSQLVCPAITVTPVLSPATMAQSASKSLVPLSQCRHIAGGMAFWGDEVRYQRFSRNLRRAITLAAQGLGCTSAADWIGCAKSAICQWLRWIPLMEPDLSSGRGWNRSLADAWLRWTHGIEGDS